MTGLTQEFDRSKLRLDLSASSRLSEDRFFRTALCISGALHLFLLAWGPLPAVTEGNSHTLQLTLPAATPLADFPVEPPLAEIRESIDPPISNDNPTPADSAPPPAVESVTHDAATHDAATHDTATHDTAATGSEGDREGDVAPEAVEESVSSEPTPSPEPTVETASVDAIVADDADLAKEESVEADAQQAAAGEVVTPENTTPEVADQAARAQALLDVLEQDADQDLTQKRYHFRVREVVYQCVHDQRENLQQATAEFPTARFEIRFCLTRKGHLFNLRVLTPPAVSGDFSKFLAAFKTLTFPPPPPPLPAVAEFDFRVEVK